MSAMPLGVQQCQSQKLHFSAILCPLLVPQEMLKKCSRNAQEGLLHAHVGTALAGSNAASLEGDVVVRLSEDVIGPIHVAQAFSH